LIDAKRCSLCLKVVAKVTTGSAGRPVVVVNCGLDSSEGLPVDQFVADPRRVASVTARQAISLPSELPPIAAPGIRSK
jgi:hypothetical protein